MDHTQNIDENGYTLPHLSNICKIYTKFFSFLMLYMSKYICKQL